MARQVNLVIENGSGVEGANSFADVEGIIAYALARGVTIPHGNDDEKDKIAVLAIKAMDYLRSKSFVGLPKTFGQNVPFPRVGMALDPAKPGELYPDDAVPDDVIEAQSRLALEAFNGVVLMPTMKAGAGMVKREKIGPIETEYSEAVGIYSFPQMPVVDALLAPFMARGGGFSLRTIRG